MPVSDSSGFQTRASGDTAVWTLKGGVTLLAIISLPVAWAACSHPPIAASFKTLPPRGASVIELADATLNAPVEAELGSFEFHQIQPPRSIDEDGMGKELLIRLGVSRGSCEELEDRIGGSCAGPEPPLHSPEGLAIETGGGTLEALLRTTSATTLSLEQTTEPRGPAEPQHWSLKGSASRMTLRLRCVVSTPIDLTLLPGEAHPECSPDGEVYKLLIVNRRPYLPSLSFNRTLTFTADAEARWAVATIHRGRLTQGTSSQSPPVTEPSEVALAAAEGDRVHLLLGSPDPAGIVATTLSASRTEAALLDWRDETLSRLDRHPTVKSWSLGILGGLLVLVFVNAVVVLGGRRESA
jgi:hypothetical protein